MRLLKYVSVLLGIYAVFWVSLAISAVILPQSEIVQKIGSRGQGVLLGVWVDAGEEQSDRIYNGVEIEIETQPLLSGEFFDQGVMESWDDVSHLLVLIEDGKALPDQSVLYFFNISNESLESARLGTEVILRTKNTRVNLSLIPVVTSSRTVFLINLSDYNSKYRTECIRDVLFTLITDAEDLETAKNDCERA